MKNSIKLNIIFMIFFASLTSNLKATKTTSDFLKEAHVCIKSKLEEFCDFIKTDFDIDNRTNEELLDAQKDLSDLVSLFTSSTTISKFNHAISPAEFNALIADLKTMKTKEHKIDLLLLSKNLPSNVRTIETPAPTPKTAPAPKSTPSLKDLKIRIPEGGILIG